MGIFLGILFFLVSFFMICAVLLQEGKGGGLAAMSGAMTDSVMGTRNPLRKITAYSFVIFLLVAVAISFQKNRMANHDLAGGLVVPVSDVTKELPATPGIDKVPAAATQAEKKSPEKTDKAAPQTTDKAIALPTTAPAASAPAPAAPATRPAEKAPAPAAASTPAAPAVPATK